MTQEEILDYNKRCAEFLGAIYSEPAEAWGFGNAKNIGSKMFHGVMYHNVIQAERFEKELKFHSDWNWIMEVVEAIENTKCDFKINTLWNEFNQCSYTQVSVIKEVGEMSKDRKVISNSVKVYEKHSNTYKNKKEAVVQAINEFLIWYEQNKTI